MILIPKNWSTFQHYKDRSPPWIKLHKHLLDDRAFMRLPVASKALAPLMWLLASESKDGTFDGSIEELAFRLRMSESEVSSGLTPLISNGFFLDASTMLAPCLQLAIPETEGETEAKAKKEAPRKRSAAQPLKPEDLSQQVWDDWMTLRKAKRLPLTETAWADTIAESQKAGLTPSEAVTHSVRSNWAGFRAAWFLKDNPAQSSGGILAGAI
jgi:hypothetical protein